MIAEACCAHSWNPSTASGAMPQEDTGRKLAPRNRILYEGIRAELECNQHARTPVVFRP